MTAAGLALGAGAAVIYALGWITGYVTRWAVTRGETGRAYDQGRADGIQQVLSAQPAGCLMVVPPPRPAGRKDAS